MIIRSLSFSALVIFICYSLSGCGGSNSSLVKTETRHFNEEDVINLEGSALFHTDWIYLFLEPDTVDKSYRAASDPGQDSATPGTDEVAIRYPEGLTTICLDTVYPDNSMKIATELLGADWECKNIRDTESTEVSEGNKIENGCRYDDLSNCFSFFSKGEEIKLRFKNPHPEKHYAVTIHPGDETALRVSEQKIEVDINEVVFDKTPDSKASPIELYGGYRSATLIVQNESFKILNLATAINLRGVWVEGKEPEAGQAINPQSTRAFTVVSDELGLGVESVLRFGSIDGYFSVSLARPWVGNLRYSIDRTSLEETAFSFSPITQETDPGHAVLELLISNREER